MEHTRPTASRSDASRDQLAREAAYQLLAESHPNRSDQASFTNNPPSKWSKQEDTTQRLPKYDSLFSIQEHDTKAYLLVIILAAFWLGSIDFSHISRNEAFIAALVDFVRVAAVTIIIFVLDWYNHSLLTCDTDLFESHRTSIARTFALSLFFVMIADGMRLDTRSLW